MAASRETRPSATSSYTEAEGLGVRAPASANARGGHCNLWDARQDSRTESPLTRETAKWSFFWITLDAITDGVRPPAA